MEQPLLCFLLCSTCYKVNKEQFDKCISVIMEVTHTNMSVQEAILLIHAYVDKMLAVWLFGPK